MVEKEGEGANREEKRLEKCLNGLEKRIRGVEKEKGVKEEKGAEGEGV